MKKLLAILLSLTLLLAPVIALIPDRIDGRIVHTADSSDPLKSKTRHHKKR